MTSNTSSYDLSNMEQLNRAEPGYLAAYGLTEAPFSTQQDDRFFYSSAELAEQLELIKHYTQYGNLLLIISGERGIGKSSLKQRFISTAQQEWKLCEIQSHTMMDASMLLRQVANGFGITEPPLEPSDLLEVLGNQLEHLHQDAQTPILIIDDAHELPQDSLQALLYLAEHHSNQENALRIILFCEPEIEIMLEDPAIHSLKDRITHAIELPALDETQTAEYLRHRLAVAGLDGTSPFTPQLVHKIFKASGGIPAKINEYAHQNLQDDSEPFISEERDINTELIHETTPFTTRNIILGSIALVFIISVLLFQDQINQQFEEPEIEVTEIKQPEFAQAEETVSPPDDPVASTEPAPQPIEEKTIEFTLNDKPSNQEKTQQQPEMAEQTKPEIKNVPVIRLSSVNPSPVPASKQRQIISISGQGLHKRQHVKVGWTGKEKILSETQVNVTSDSYMNLILNTGTNADTWTVTVIDPLLNLESNTITFNVVANDSKVAKKEKPAPVVNLASKKPQPSAVKKNKLGLYDQAWIKKQNKQHFTLQLLGTHNKNTLPSYLKKYNLNSEAATFKTKRSGNDWFTLVYGRYNSKREAEIAASKLPKAAGKPWIRSFASILPSLTETEVSPPANTVLNAQSTISSNQEGWLWSQDPSHYTLQLAAGTDKKAIQAFINRHGLRGKAVFFHRIRDGKDWYILVHGSYPGYSVAKQAISKLPPALQKAKPWTRSFSAIHAELN